MSRYATGSHTKYYHRYHIVWTTKYRYKVLQGQLRERIRDIIRQVCGEMGVTIIKGVLSSDHVHILVAIPPHLPVARAGSGILNRGVEWIPREIGMIAESEERP